MPWGAYVEFAKRAFSREATYREEVFTHIGSVALRVYLYYALWSALYANNGPQQDFSFNDIITYATLALLLGLIYNICRARKDPRGQHRDRSHASDQRSALRLR